MADALPGQFYRDVVRDRRGNAVSDVVVDVLDADTEVLLYTTTTDADGEYAIPLTGALEDRVLVNLRFSGPIPTKTLEGLVLV